MRRPWIVREIDEERQQALAEDLSISRITASVLLARGIVTTEQARQWLRPGWTAGHDPWKSRRSCRVKTRMKWAWNSVP